MGFDNPNYDVGAFFPPFLSVPEHRIGLAHTRSSAEEYLQLALALALLLSDCPAKEFVGIWSFRFHNFDIPEMRLITA
jgi:hypothetical protein